MSILGNFKTKARAIELLGRKQIRDGVTALAELMKNSYDADADWIHVEFVTNSENPYILICDDGYGMNEDEITGKWLVLGTDSKKDKKGKTTPKGRLIMGEKGIGRLAAAQLGQQMWMFTKKIDTNWSILYINWNVFENPNIFIEEVIVPAKFNIEYTLLKNNGASLADYFVDLQRENVKLPIWFSEENPKLLKNSTADLFHTINKQIENINLPFNHINAVCSVLEKQQQGTVLLISDFNEDWDRYLSPNTSDKDRRDDLVAYKNYTRFAAFASDFRQAVKNKEYNVEIVFNQKKIYYNFDYLDEDFNICDLKIEGEVIKGKFYGKFFARNADIDVLDECNMELQNGLPVTSGLKGWEGYECGPYKVKLCHIELMRNNSGLTEDEFNYITKKSEVAGGICVYRDKVRVLPYGEPENDFLNLERRRSQNAGLYLFSHRNIFGRIDINTNDNPKLEDKSSREGLIENAEYHYFIKTLENLLTTIASSFITSRGKKASKALRDTYIEKNKMIAEEKRIKEETEKREKDLAKESIKFSNELINKTTKLIPSLRNELNNFLNTWESKASEVDSHDGLHKLTQELREFRTAKSDQLLTLSNYEKDLEITIPPRFASAFTKELRNKIDSSNEFLIIEINNIRNELNKKCIGIEECYQKRIKEWKDTAENDLANDPQKLVNELNDRIRSISSYINTETSSIRSQIKVEKLKIENEVRPIIDKLNIINETEKEAEKMLKESKLNSFNNELTGCQSELSKIFNLSPLSVKDQARILIDKLDMIEKRVFEYSSGLKLSIGQNYSSIVPAIQPILSYINNDESVSVDYLIGTLKQKNQELEEEVELCADLASLGLSAEIVSHEFNQLFTNVNEAIKRLSKAGLPQNTLYWLRQIEIGFRAISDRQSQLSPMYRSYNLPKRSTSVKSIVDDLRNFFEPILERNQIELLNEVDDNIQIVISQSKIYPVLSNIIHNSIYWVLDQNIRKILFHYDEKEHSLYIEDTGSGIGRNIAEEIFKPFFTRKPGGRGLGLAISKKVLESQGHQIEVIFNSSQKRLNGACFKIIFNTSDI